MPNACCYPLFGEVKILRPDTTKQLAGSWRCQDRAIRSAQNHAAAAPFKRKEIHRRRPDEARTETGCRPSVDFGGRRVLLDVAVAQEDDLISHAHGFGLVMGYVKHGDAEPTLKRQNLAPHVGAKLRVEVRQRFVHQTDRRLGHDGATESHTLLLAAGKLARLAVHHVADAKDFHRTREPTRALSRRHPARLQTEDDVFCDTQVWEQGIGLKHHRNPARGGGQVGDIATGNLDPALGGGFEAGNDSQACGLAAA